MIFPVSKSLLNLQLNIYYSRLFSKFCSNMYNCLILIQDLWILFKMEINTHVLLIKFNTPKEVTLLGIYELYMVHIFLFFQ